MTPANRATDDYDIAIVGAGAAGVAAAAVAGPAARVILIEGSDRLGGSVTAAMHRSICGLYSREPKDALDTLNAGVQRDLVRRVLEKSPSDVRPRQLGKAWVLEFPTAGWESSLREMVDESKAVLLLGRRVNSVEREGSRVRAIEADGCRIAVKVLIDCTGGGHVLQLVGADAHQPAEDPNHRMLGGFGFRIGGIAGDLEMLGLQVAYVLANAVTQKLLPETLRYTSFYPGPGPSEGVCKLAINLNETTPGDADSLADRAFQQLKREIAAFGSAKIVEKSPRVLPRDGLRLRGKGELKERDVLSARKLGRECVHAWWPMEHWDAARGPSYGYPPDGEHYDISTDMLRSEGIENLLAAGTCVSATAAAAASSRASGICLATGALAGEIALSLLT